MKILGRPAPPSPIGDPELAARIAAARDRHTHRVAAIRCEAGSPPRLALLRAEPHTRFELGSVSKALTGLLLADARERQELTAATAVGDVLAETAGSPLADVTLGELCAHTSGLPRLPASARSALNGIAFGCFGIDPYRGESTAAVIRAATAQPLRNRGRELYSNLGAAIAGAMAARAADREFGVLLRERLLDPLRMLATDLGEVPPEWGRSARGWPRMPWRLGGYAPAGGVVSTPADVGTLCRALAERRAPGRAALEAIGPAAGGRSRGLFWSVDPDRGIAWHNGATGGYSAFLAVRPAAGRAVAVLADDTRTGERERLALTLLR